MFESPPENGVTKMRTHSDVTRDQFEVRADLVIHTPTGAEFVPGSEDSVMVWTGEIGKTLYNGAVYRYGEVLAMMKTVWHEFLIAPRDSSVA